MRPALHITVELADHTAVFSLTGQLDAETSPSLLQCLVSLELDYRTVIIDLGKVEAVDGSAVRALVAWREEMAVRMQRLELRGAAGRTAAMLEMAGAVDGTAAG